MPNHELHETNVPLRFCNREFGKKGPLLFISQYLQHALRRLLLRI